MYFAMEQACTDCLIHHTAARGHYRHAVSQNNHFLRGWHTENMVKYQNTQCDAVLCFVLSFFLHPTNTQYENLLATKWKPVYIWCIAVNNGRTDADDKQQTRHPCISTIDDDVCYGKTLNQRGQMLKLTDITQELDVSLGSTHSTVHNPPAYRQNVCMLGTDQVMVYADNNIMGENIHTIKKNTEASLVASNEILEVMLRSIDVHVSKTECRTQ
jgi:hypothetical protein